MICEPLTENLLSLPLQIHHMSLWAPSPGQVVLLLVTRLINKHSDHELCCLFHGAQYQADLLHEYRQVQLESITQKTLIQNFK